MVDGERNILAVKESLMTGIIKVETEFGKGCGNDEILNLKVWIDGLEGGQVLNGGGQRWSNYRA